MIKYMYCILYTYMYLQVLHSLHWWWLVTIQYTSILLTRLSVFYQVQWRTAPILKRAWSVSQT